MLLEKNIKQTDKIIDNLLFFFIKDNTIGILQNNNNLSLLIILIYFNDKYKEEKEHISKIKELYFFKFKLI